MNSQSKKRADAFVDSNRGAQVFHIVSIKWFFQVGGRIFISTTISALFRCICSKLGPK